MRLVLVADLHSNIHALKAASELIDAASPDAVVCAGDIVGYGAFPNECCSWAEKACSRCVAGNHDRAAISKDMARMNPFAAAAALWTSDRLDGDSRSFLSALEGSARLEAGDVRIAIFHGSPSDPDEYVEEGAAADGMLAEAGCDVLVLGHTHIPYARRLAKGLAVNPGSVGQPRDGDPRGSFAVLDTGRLDCEIVRFVYPVKEAADSMLSEGLPHILAERLFIGR